MSARNNTIHPLVRPGLRLTFTTDSIAAWMTLVGRLDCTLSKSEHLRSGHLEDVTLEQRFPDGFGIATHQPKRGERLTVA